MRWNLVPTFSTVSVGACTGAIAAVFLFSVAPVRSQVSLPEALQGDWGSAAQCEAARGLPGDETAGRIIDAPYRFEGYWLSRQAFYCLSLRVEPLTDGYRVRALCGEDATERPWEIDISIEQGQIRMDWYAVAEVDGRSRPWSVGPLVQCQIPQS